MQNAYVKCVFIDKNPEHLFLEFYTTSTSISSNLCKRHLGGLKALTPRPVTRYIRTYLRSKTSSVKL